jgi:hypothetical protein
LCSSMVPGDRPFPQLTAGTFGRFCSDDKSSQIYGMTVGHIIARPIPMEANVQLLAPASKPHEEVKKSLKVQVNYRQKFNVSIEMKEDWADKVKRFY